MNIHACKDEICHNPSLGLVTKARACKGGEPRGSPRVTFDAPGSVRECEGINPHNPKGTPILGVRVLMDSRIFQEQLKESKSNGLKNSLYHWKAFGM
jgi:hypothetical protein